MGFKVNYMENDTHFEKTGKLSSLTTSLRKPSVMINQRLMLCWKRLKKTSSQFGRSSRHWDKKDISNMPVVNINEDAKIVTQTKSGQTIEAKLFQRTYNFELRRFTHNKLLVDREAETS